MSKAESCNQCLDFGLQSDNGSAILKQNVDHKLYIPDLTVSGCQNLHTDPNYPPLAYHHPVMARRKKNSAIIATSANGPRARNFVVPL